MNAPYMKSESFFGLDLWAAHDRIGELLAQGVTQITVALEGDAYTVSWPSRTPPPVLPEGMRA